MVTIEVYEKETKELIHVFDGTDLPTFVGEVLTFDYKDNENVDFIVYWCSEPNNGKQIAIVE